MPVLVTLTALQTSRSQCYQKIKTVHCFSLIRSCLIASNAVQVVRSSIYVKKRISGCDLKLLARFFDVCLMFDFLKSNFAVF